jgi:hypothetical protein
MLSQLSSQVELDPSKPSLSKVTVEGKVEEESWLGSTIVIPVRYQPEGIVSVTI